MASTLLPRRKGRCGGTEIWQTIDRYTFPRLHRQEQTEEARVKYVLTSSYPIPLKCVVGSFENQLPNFNEARLAFGTPFDPLIRKFLPAAALAVDTSNLLLEDGRVPLSVELHDYAAGFVEVEPLTTDLTLRDEDPRRGAGSIECGLKIAPGLPARGALE